MFRFVNCSARTTDIVLNKLPVNNIVNNKIEIIRYSRLTLRYVSSYIVTYVHSYIVTYVHSYIVT